MKWHKPKEGEHRGIKNFGCFEREKAELKIKLKDCINKDYKFLIYRVNKVREARD